jgi:hypothetical protein
MYILVKIGLSAVESASAEVHKLIVHNVVINSVAFRNRPVKTEWNQHLLLRVLRFVRCSFCGAEWTSQNCILSG